MEKNSRGTFFTLFETKKPQNYQKKAEIPPWLPAVTPEKYLNTAV